MLGSVGLGLGSVGTAAEAGAESSTAEAHESKLRISSLIDLTVVADTIVIPAQPGAFLYTVGSTAGIRLCYAQTGATAGPTISIFNDSASHNNIVSPQAIGLPTGGAVSGLPITQNLQQVGNATLVDLASPVIFRVSIAATGGALKARLTIFGCILPKGELQ